MLCDCGMDPGDGLWKQSGVVADPQTSQIGCVLRVSPKFGENSGNFTGNTFGRSERGSPPPPDRVESGRPYPYSRNQVKFLREQHVYHCSQLPKHVPGKFGEFGEFPEF